MTIVKLIILAIIQGLTEPLPISSSGHLVIFEELLNIQLPGYSFELFVNFGSLLGVIVFFWSDLFGYIKTIKEKETLDYSFKVVVGVIPAGLVGFLFNDMFEHFKTSRYVAIFLIFTAILLLLPSLVNGNRKKVTWFDSVYIGLAQIIALLPGVSRSAVTTVSGVTRGLTKEEAFKYSFMLYIPISFLSGLYSLTKLTDLSLMYVVYFLVAAVMTYVGLLLFKKVFMSNKLYYFSIYCVIIAVLIL